MIIPVGLSFTLNGFLHLFPNHRSFFNLTVELELGRYDPREELLLVLIAHLIVWWRFDAWQIRKGFSLKRILQRRPSEM